MATGASTADAAVLLVDARKGVLTQTRRHAANLNRLKNRHPVQGQASARRQRQPAALPRTGAQRPAQGQQAQRQT